MQKSMVADSSMGASGSLASAAAEVSSSADHGEQGPGELAWYGWRCPAKRSYQLLKPGSEDRIRSPSLQRACAQSAGPRVQKRDIQPGIALAGR